MLALGLACLLAVACGNSTGDERAASLAGEGPSEGNALVEPAGATIDQRFKAPEGFARTEELADSFAAYLRNLPLKPHGSRVKLYDGREKANESAYEAVVDLAIGRRDLHQCADAVMRLRAEYLFSRGAYERIHFDLSNGFRADYAEWMRGRRIVERGDETRWEQRAAPSNSRRDLWNYLEMVFAYAGTWSLSRELRPVPIDDLRIGDVFIVGGFPGHAVIVADLAVAPDGTKVFLLAQSYMPAQEIHVLRNPTQRSLSPWYPVPGGELRTPEWTFASSDLKRFPD
jgi:hypothetical protein